MRQSDDANLSYLPFVSFTNGASSTEIAIDTIGLYTGTYTLVLESFDQNDQLQ